MKRVFAKILFPICALLYAAISISSVAAQQQRTADTGDQFVSATSDYSDLIGFAAVVFLLTIIALVSYLVIQFRKLRNNTDPDQTTIAFSRMRTIVVILFVGITFFISTFGYFALNLAKTTTVDDVSEKLLHGLNSTNQRVGIWLNRQKSYLQLLASDPDFVARIEKLAALMSVDPNGVEAKNYIEGLRKHFSNISTDFESNGFAITSIDGKNIATESDTNTGQANVVFATRPELFRSALSSGQAVFVPSLTNDIPVDGVSLPDLTLPLAMFFGIAVKSAQGDPLAVLFLRVDPASALSGILAHSRQGRTGETYAFDTDGYLLTNLRNPDQIRKFGLVGQDFQVAYNLELKDPGGDLTAGYKPQLSRAKQAQILPVVNSIVLSIQFLPSGVSDIGINKIGYSNVLGRTVYGAWAWSYDLDAGIVSEIDVDEALAGYVQFRNLILVVILSSLALTACVTTASLALGHRANLVLRKAKEDLEEEVRSRTEELVASEAQSRRSQEKLNALFEALPIGVVMFGQEGEIVEANTITEEVLGVSKDEHKMRGLSEGNWQIIRPDGTEMPVEEYPASRVLAGEGSILNFMMGVHRPKGDLVWISVSAAPLGQEAGGGAAVAFENITDRLAMEQSLEAERKLLRKILDTSPVGVGISVDGIMRLVNPQFVQMNNIDVGGDAKTSYVQPADRVRIEELMQQDGIVQDFETRSRARDGSIRDVMATFYQIDYEGDQGYLSWEIDISDLKKIQNDLAEAKETADAATQAKSEFLANMSHEIRTPMNAIIGLSNLALETELSEKQKDYVTKIEGSGKALLGIINDILDFSKIEAGKLTMEKIAFDLHSDVLENLSSVIGMKAAEQGLELLYDFDADLPSALVGDPLRLGQVLINLGNNAIKFTEQGEITLAIQVSALDDEQVQLRVEVRDTGIGMTKEQTDKLFQAFSQADTTTTRKFGGTGLGLTISKSLVELMDGDIGVESEAGVGSTFWFTARFGRATEEDVTQRRQLDVDLKGLRVLVVDDNPTARTILSRYLTAFEYDVAEAGSGEEALGILETAPDNAQFDLVLMDWKMPIMDGLEATRRIKSDDKLSSVPAVLMVTAFDREQLEEEASGTDFEGVLLKPVSQSSLLDGIMMAFGKELGIRERRKTQSLPPHCLGARILLVEDNEINQQVATEILEKAGCEVTLAVDGRDGVNAAKARPDYYDCILMDIQMPVLDGYGAATEIRKDERLDGVPVIAMTANAFSSDREQALEVGMVDHVAKPIEVKNLFDVMGQWVTVPEERRGEAVETDEIEDNPVSLPEIAGVDTKSGLERLGGNAELYLSLLQDFTQQQGQSDDIVRKALAAGDHTLAEREAHTVKGVAANLGIRSLNKCAQALEAAIPGADEADTNECLEHYANELKASVSAIMKALGDNALTEPETGVPQEQENEAQDGQLSRTILVAEDSTINQKIIGRQLAMAGYECAMAEDGKVALEMLASNQYGLLMTDLSMPEVDGYELAATVRRQTESGSPGFPIIAIAGTLTEAEIERCLSVGMDDCLAKPIDMDELQKMLDKYLPLDD